MQELVPVVIGIVIGVIAASRPRGQAVAGVGAAALVFGILVASATGELARSIGYAFFDAGVIACTAVLAIAAQRLVHRTPRETAQEGRRD